MAFPFICPGTGENPPHCVIPFTKEVYIQLRISHLYKSSKVRRLLTKQADPGVAVEAVTSYDEASRLLCAVREFNSHRVFLLLQGFEFVSPLNRYSFCLGMVYEGLQNDLSSDSQDTSTEVLSHSSGDVIFGEHSRIFR